MKMKTKIFFLAVLLLLAAGCEKILIEEPFTFLAPESLTTVEGAEAAQYDRSAHSAGHGQRLCDLSAQGFFRQPAAGTLRSR